MPASADNDEGTHGQKLDLGAPESRRAAADQTGVSVEHCKSQSVAFVRVCGGGTDMCVIAKMVREMRLER